MLQKLMSFEEAREYLSISKPSLYRLVQSGKVPASKVGGLWRFRKREIDAWLKRQQISYRELMSKTVLIYPRRRKEQGKNDDGLLSN